MTINLNKYQLSLTDPREGIVLYAELDDYFDKLYSGRLSELGGVVNLDDRQRSSLSRSERPSLSSKVDNTLRRSICRGEIF